VSEAEKERLRRAQLKLSNPDLWSALYADDDEIIASIQGPWELRGQ
jgi:hypothetical protein